MVCLYVWFFRLNREQNQVDVLYGSPDDMSTRLVLREENDTWIDVETSFGDLAGGTITYLDDDQALRVDERTGRVPPPVSLRKRWYIRAAVDPRRLERYEFSRYCSRP